MTLRIRPSGAVSLVALTSTPPVCWWRRSIAARQVNTADASIVDRRGHPCRTDGVIAHAAQNLSVSTLPSRKNWSGSGYARRRHTGTRRRRAPCPPSPEASMFRAAVLCRLRRWRPPADRDSDRPRPGHRLPGWEQDARPGPGEQPVGRLRHISGSCAAVKVLPYAGLGEAAAGGELCTESRSVKPCTTCSGAAASAESQVLPQIVPAARPPPPAGEPVLLDDQHSRAASAAIVAAATPAVLP